MIDESTVPIPKTQVDIVALSPSAEQYFLFSRVDGKLTVEQLCQTSGLGRENTLECLRFLAGAGAIEIPGFEASSAPDPTPDPTPAQTQADDAPAAKPKPKPEPEAATQADRPKSKAPVLPNYPISPENFEFDPELLAIETPLEETVRRELICLHEQLEEMSYYDLFGLSIDAKRKEIKRAYFRLSKRHHPDKFFRQDLGVLGSMQETVFREIARAYTTLSKKSSRKEYDAALSAHLSGQAASKDASSGAGAEANGLEEADAQEALRERNKRKAAATLLVRRAEKYEARGQYAEASEEYRKALALTREPELALRVATLMLNTAKMPKEAACFARAALKLGAPMASARYILGRAMQAVGAEQAAIQEFQKVLADTPDHPGARAGLGELEKS